MKDFSPSGWHSLCEHWISGEPEKDFQSIDRIIEKVRDLDLEPVQLERIREAIKAAIQDPVKNVNQNPDNSAVLIRLWVPYIGIADSSGTGLEDQPAHRIGSNGPGFFVFEKTVGEPENPWKVSYRMVNVLIYGK